MLNNLGLGLELTMEENITSSANEVTQSFNDVQDSAQAMVDNVNQSMQTFQNIAVGGMALSQAGNNVLQFGNTITGAFASVGKQTMGITSLFEKLRITIATLFEGEANEALEWAIEMGKTTPFRTTNLVKGMVSLKGLGIDVREEFEGIEGVTQNMASWIGDLAGIRPDLGLSGALGAAQMFMMGRQRRLQMSYGMRTDQVLGEDMGETPEERAEQFIAMVSTRGFTGLMSDLEGSWLQLMSNLTDYKDDFLRGIGEAGLFEKVKNTVIRFISALEGIDFAKTGEALSNVLETLYKPIDMLARGVTNLTAKFLNFAERYPAMTKLFGVILGGIGITATLTGIVMKLSGGFMMAFASVGMLVTQISLLNVATNGATASITGMLGGLKALIGTLGTFAFGAGIAFYAWQRNLYGFQDAVNGLIDDIMNNDVFAKIQAFGKLLYNLFAEDTGSEVFFSDSLRAELESLDMWELAVNLTMLKGRFNSLFEGIFEGFGGVIDFSTEFANVLLEPIRYINDEFGIFDGLLESANEKDLGVYHDVGKALGTIGGVLFGLKLLSGLKFLGTIFGFIAKKALFATGAIKLLPFIGLAVVLNEFVDLGDLVETSFNKMSNAFEKFQDFAEPVWNIFKDFGDNVGELGLSESFNIAINDLGSWWDEEGKGQIKSLFVDISNGIRDLYNDTKDSISFKIRDFFNIDDDVSLSGGVFSSLYTSLVDEIENFEFPDVLGTLNKGVELVYDVTGIDFSLENIISSAIDIKASLYNMIADALGWLTEDGRTYDTARIVTKFIVDAVEWVSDSINDITGNLLSTIFDSDSDVDSAGRNLSMSIGKLTLELAKFVLQLGAGIVAGITEGITEEIDLSWKNVKEWTHENLTFSALFAGIMNSIEFVFPNTTAMINNILDWWNGIDSWTTSNVSPDALFEDVFSGWSDWLPEMPDVVGKLGEWKDSLYDWFNKFEFPEFPSLSMPDLGGWFGGDDDNDSADPKKPSAQKSGGYPESPSNNQNGSVNTKGNIKVDSLDRSIKMDEVNITVPVPENTSRQSARQQALMILEELKEISKEDNDRNYNINDLNGV